MTKAVADKSVRTQFLLPRKTPRFIRMGSPRWGAGKRRRKKKNKVLAVTATQLRQEEDEELTLEEGAARNEPGVAVVDDQGLVHVVAQLLLHLQVITS